MPLTEFAVALLAILCFTGIVDSDVVLSRGVSCRLISTAAINIYTAAFVLISKAKCDQWIRSGGGGLCVHQSKTHHSAWHIVAHSGEPWGVYWEKRGGGMRVEGLVRRVPQGGSWLGGAKEFIGES